MSQLLGEQPAEQLREDRQRVDARSELWRRAQLARPRLPRRFLGKVREGSGRVRDLRKSARSRRGLACSTRSTKSRCSQRSHSVHSSGWRGEYLCRTCRGRVRGTCRGHVIEAPLRGEHSAATRALRAAAAGTMPRRRAASASSLERSSSRASRDRDSSSGLSLRSKAVRPSKQKWPSTGERTKRFSV